MAMHWIRRTLHHRFALVLCFFAIVVMFFVFHFAILSVGFSSRNHWWEAFKLGSTKRYSQHKIPEGDFRSRARTERIGPARNVGNNAVAEQISEEDEDNVGSQQQDMGENEGDSHVGFAPPEGAQLRVVHLDLKGAPPKLRYLKSLLPHIAAAGANALLLEYEDMFPFEGSLKNLSAKNAYTKEQVMQILKWARDQQLEIIPLVQTFGHLEFALKLPEFRHLRELAAFPQEICPSNPDSMRILVKEMLRQVMAIHQSVRYLHIGCDEVYHLAACNRCSRRHIDGRLLFTEHVTAVAQHVRNTYPGVTPLIWDDMLRQWSPMDLADSGLGELVEPVVWVYIDDIPRLLPHYVWYMYGRVFRSGVWVAGAFKGAFGETAVAPNIKRHFDNNMAWLRIIRAGQVPGMPVAVKKNKEADWSPNMVQTFRGIVLTGWSRYDHFAVLCELLPVSIPSLLLNILLISTNPDQQVDEKHMFNHVFRKWVHRLSCPASSLSPPLSYDSFASDPYQWRLGELCSFPGSNLFAAVAHYVSLKARVDDLYMELTELRGWMTSYNVRMNYTSPWRVIEAWSEGGGLSLVREVNEYTNATARIMTQYFDRYTVDEWLEQKVQPLTNKMTQLERRVAALTSRDTWPRRPLSWT